MKKVAVFLLLLVISAFFLFCCDKKPQNAAQVGKVMSYPEIKVENTAGVKDVVVPEIPEVRWDFYKEEGKRELTCKYRMQVNFKVEAKFMAKVQFLDLNNFPVTTEKVKLIGLKDEQRMYEQSLYIDPKVSQRITKVQIVLTPIP